MPGPFGGIPGVCISGVYQGKGYTRRMGWGGYTKRRLRVYQGAGHDLVYPPTMVLISRDGYQSSQYASYLNAFLFYCIVSWILGVLLYFTTLEILSVLRCCTDSRLLRSLLYCTAAGIFIVLAYCTLSGILSG